MRFKQKDSFKQLEKELYSKDFRIPVIRWDVMPGREREMARKVGKYIQIEGRTVYRELSTLPPYTIVFVKEWESLSVYRDGKCIGSLIPGRHLLTRATLLGLDRVVYQDTIYGLEGYFVSLQKFAIPFGTLGQTRELLPLRIRGSALISIKDPLAASIFVDRLAGKKLIYTVGDVKRVIAPFLCQYSQRHFATYDLAEVYSEGLPQLSTRIEIEVGEELERYGIYLQAVRLEIEVEDKYRLARMFREWGVPPEEVYKGMVEMEIGRGLRPGVSYARVTLNFPLRPDFSSHGWRYER